MADRFRFDADETVAIMGAHTLDRALPENSGFEGEDGWVSDELVLGKCLYHACPAILLVMNAIHAMFSTSLLIRQ